MELKDVIHFYLGCKAKVKRKLDTEYHIGRISEVTRQSNHGDWVEVWFDNVIEVTGRTFEKSSSNAHTFFLTEDSIQLVLRKLSDMTEDDIKEWSDVTVNHTPYCVELDSKDDFGEFTMAYPDGSILSKSKDDGDIRPINGGLLFTLLIKRGFDLFNLIDTNQAIDAKTLQP